MAENLAILDAQYPRAHEPLAADDPKALKGSFGSLNDAKARQVLSAFAVDTARSRDDDHPRLAG
jgi:hypothetical protein